MEDNLTFAFLVMAVATMIFGTYKVGRHMERKALTKHFVEMTELTYADGYTDGMKRCESERAR